MFENQNHKTFLHEINAKQTNKPVLDNTLHSWSDKTWNFSNAKVQFCQNYCLLNFIFMHSTYIKIP